MNRDDVEVLDRKTVCQSYFRIDRYRLKHRLFGGGWSAPVMREVFERGHSCACLLYDPKADVVILIEQFRAGAFAAGMGPWLIECVAGIIDEGETPEDVARRESGQECGCTVGPRLAGRATAPGQAAAPGRPVNTGASRPISCRWRPRSNGWMDTRSTMPRC